MSNIPKKGLKINTLANNRKGNQTESSQTENPKYDSHRVEIDREARTATITLRNARLRRKKRQYTYEQQQSHYVYQSRDRNAPNKYLMYEN